MPDTVIVNKLSISHKASGGVSTATIPDVCKTPSPAGPVPIPYPNVSMSNTLAKGTKTVKVDGGQMAAIKGSEYSMSVGDEPGVTGGVKSSTFKKESTWILYSFDVKMEGKNVCRLTDKKFHNHQNTVNLAGDIEPPPTPPPAPPRKEPCAKCGEHHKTLENLNSKGDQTAASQIESGLGTFRKHKDVTNSDWDKDLCDLAQQNDKSSQVIIKLVKQQKAKIAKLKSSQRRGRH